MLENRNLYKIFIVDAALIFEANYKNFFNQTILITASKKTRIERAIERRNIPSESIQNRISLQMSDKKKKEIADHTIINNGSKEKLYSKLELFYGSLKI